jgi:putative ABC transport system ATP-binding protein
MLIRLKAVSKVYDLGGHQVQALKNISTVIKKGEFTSIMGPSGSGKSTLMNMIGLLDKPSSGQVFLEGKEVSQLNEAQLAELRNKKIGFVFQQFNLLEKTTALENVKLPLIYNDNVSKEQRNTKGRKVLKSVGLEHRIHHLPNQLSGGQQQRVAIARALINDPEILLADEPTGNVDSKTGKKIMEILQDLNNQGRTIIVVTHDQNIAKWAKRIIKIKDGEITN